MDVYGYRKQTYKAGLANQTHNRPSFEQRSLPTQISLPFFSQDEIPLTVDGYKHPYQQQQQGLAQRPAQHYRTQQRQLPLYAQRQRSLRTSQRNASVGLSSPRSAERKSNDMSSPYYSKVIEPSTPELSSSTKHVTTMTHTPSTQPSEQTTAQGFQKWSAAHKLKSAPTVPSVECTPPLIESATVHLLKTFQRRDPRFNYHQHRNPKRILTKPSKPAKNDGYDNEDHDYILHVNDILGEDKDFRYRVIDLLGQGTFGQVVKCELLSTGKLYSVKVIKNRPAFRTQSCMEVEILKQLNQKMDARNQHHILRLEHTFNHKNHLCLVFELLSFNLYELIKQNGFKGLSIQLVRNITTQLLETLVFLADVMIIHCDLKPENILLESVDSPKIKVIDFGSACHKANPGYTYIQSRFYRSPEVLLKCRYTHAIDMWSLGCITAELFLGIPLFPGSNEYDQLNRIMDMLGEPKSDILDRGGNTLLYFDHESVGHNKYQYKRKSREKYNKDNSKQEIPSKRYFKHDTLANIIMHADYSSKTSTSGTQAYQLEKQMREWLIDFLLRTLCLNPLRRWSPREALQHPFITGKITPELAPLASATRLKLVNHDLSSIPGENKIRHEGSIIVSKENATENQREQSSKVNSCSLPQQQQKQHEKDEREKQQYFHYQKQLQQPQLQQRQDELEKSSKSYTSDNRPKVESFETSPLVHLIMRQPEDHKKQVHQRQRRSLHLPISQRQVETISHECKDTSTISSRQDDSQQATSPPETTPATIAVRRAMRRQRARSISNDARGMLASNVGINGLLLSSAMQADTQKQNNQ